MKMATEQIGVRGQTPGPSRNESKWRVNQSPAIDARDLFVILRRRKWTMIVCVVSITALATLVVSMFTPQYVATSSVMLEEQQPQLGELQSIVTGLPVGNETVQSEVAVILSRDFANRVIQKLRLYDLPEFNASLRKLDGWRQKLAAVGDFVRRQLPTGSEQHPITSVEEQFDNERIQMINALLDKVAVEPRQGTWVLDITTKSETGAMAARLANTVADLYLVDQLEAKYDTTKRAAEWLTQRMSDMRTELENSEAAVEQFRTSAGLLQGGGNVTLAQQQISEVSSQLVVARAQRAAIEARLRQAEKLLASPAGASASADVLQSPVIQHLLAQQTEVLRKISELSSSAGNNYPPLLAARAEERDLLTAISVEISKVVESLRNDAIVARTQESSLAQSLQDLEAKVGGSSGKEAQLRVLEREAETSRLLYETFTSKFKEMQDQEKIQQSDARVISRADVPLVPTVPNKPMVIALAAVTSIFVGFLAVGLRETFDRGLRSMDEVYRYFELPCLGLVPTISTLRLAGKPPENHVIKKPSSAFTESIRSIRTGILLDEPSSGKIIVVTSARPNEGKTAIAVSMARVNAMGGRRSILVELDLRKPEISKRLRARIDDGVIDYLAAQRELADVIQREDATGLDYIVAGNRVANFAELLRSNRLEGLLTELSRRYELVVLDVPPVLAVGDTRLISRLADKTIFVVRWGDTPREAVRLSLQQLADAGIDVAGIVISMVDPRRNSQYGFGDSEAFTGAFKRYYAG